MIDSESDSRWEMLLVDPLEIEIYEQCPPFRSKKVEFIFRNGEIIRFRNKDHGTEVHQDIEYITTLELLLGYLDHPLPVKQITPYPYVISIKFRGKSMSIVFTGDDVVSEDPYDIYDAEDIEELIILVGYSYEYLMLQKDTLKLLTLQFEEGKDLDLDMPYKKNIGFIRWLKYKYDIKEISKLTRLDLSNLLANYSEYILRVCADESIFLKKINVDFKEVVEIIKGIIDALNDVGDLFNSSGNTRLANNFINFLYNEFAEARGGQLYDITWTKEDNPEKLILQKLDNNKNLYLVFRNLIYEIISSISFYNKDKSYIDDEDDDDDDISPRLPELA